MSIFTDINMLLKYPAIHFTRLIGPRAVEENVAAEPHKQAQREPNERQFQSVVQLEQEGENFDECSICFTWKANHVALPCGHAGCFGPCLDTLDPRLCPYCRDQFLQSQQVGKFHFILTKKGFALYTLKNDSSLIFFHCVAAFIEGRMCQTNVVNTVCVPCGHAIVCLDCAPNYLEEGCCAA